MRQFLSKHAPERWRGTLGKGAELERLNNDRHLPDQLKARRDALSVEWREAAEAVGIWLADEIAAGRIELAYDERAIGGTRRRTTQSTDSVPPLALALGFRLHAQRRPGGDSRELLAPQLRTISIEDVDPPVHRNPISQFILTHGASLWVEKLQRLRVARPDIDKAYNWQSEPEWSEGIREAQAWLRESITSGAVRLIARFHPEPFMKPLPAKEGRYIGLSDNWRVDLRGFLLSDSELELGEPEGMTVAHPFNAAKPVKPETPKGIDDSKHLVNIRAAIAGGMQLAQAVYAEAPRAEGNSTESSERRLFLKISKGKLR